MTLSASGMGTPIEVALIAAGGTGPGTPGLALAIGTAVVGEITSHAIVPFGALVAAGAAVTGTSIVTNLDADRLKVPLRAALISAGAADITKTTVFATDLATAIVSEISTFASIPGTGFVAPPAGGPVTGASTVSGLNAVRLAIPVLAAFVTAALPGEAAPIPTATLALAIALAIVLEIATNGVVPGGALVAPGGGGPLTGATVIT